MALFPQAAPYGIAYIQWAGGSLIIAWFKIFQGN
jgi:hypothetical protein